MGKKRQQQLVAIAAKLGARASAAHVSSIVTKFPMPFPMLFSVRFPGICVPEAIILLLFLFLLFFGINDLLLFGGRRSLVLFLSWRLA